MVDPENISVVAAWQVGKRHHYPISPDSPTGHTVSGGWRIALTEIFAIRIKRGNLRTHRYLAKGPEAAAPLLHVGQAGKNGGPKTPSSFIVSLPSYLPPQGRGCGESIRLRGCCGGAGNVARTVDAKTKAVRAAESAEVDHLIAGLRLCRGKAASKLPAAIEVRIVFICSSTPSRRRIRAELLTGGRKFCRSRAAV